MEGFMRLFAFTMMFLLVAGIACGADIDGKWEGEIDMQGQTFPVSYNFKADGAVLTGTTPGMQGEEMELKDGKIDGNNISFSVVFDMMGQETKIDYKGVVTGNEIKLSFDMMGQTTEILLKKAE
jgi:hypothetical protein